MSREWTYKHVPVKPETHQMLKAIAFGMGLSQSDAIAALIRKEIRPGENAVMAGERLLDEWRSRDMEKVEL